VPRLAAASRGVRAASDAKVLAVPRQTFDLLLETEPSFARALLREMAARLGAGPHRGH
jgi:CRP-like cAMP-binding protein